MLYVRCLDAVKANLIVSRVLNLFIPEIREFTISGRPSGFAEDHACLRFEEKGMDAQGIYMLRRVDWLSINLLERQLMCIVVEYTMAC